MRLGITSGCFDILHPTHILFLEKCKRECDKLIVLLDSDELILKTKGKYPLFNEQDRLIIIKSLKFVGDVFIFNSISEYVDIISANMILEDEVVVFKNRVDFPNSEEKSIVVPEFVEVRIIEDVKRFSSSSEIKEHIKSN